jgi:hypothetical protein
MKKVKSIQFAMLASALILLSSCGKQLYSYREKVNVNKETEIAKTLPKSESTQSKKVEIKATTTFITKFEKTQAQITKPTETAKIENIIKESLPASGSKSSFKTLKNEVKDIKSQFKNLHKELKKNDIKENQGLIENPIKWMLVGLILIVIGAILGALSLGGGFVAWIGSLIFLIGLLFWLLQLI